MLAVKEMRLPLVEKFFSIQGEGANAGCAAFFIRFSGCNLDCVFAGGAVCDTPWQKPKEKVTFHDLEWWMTDELEKVGLKFPKAWDSPMDELGDPEEEDLPMVIITGGEPLMARGFDALVEWLRRRSFYVAVETNGTYWRPSLEYVNWVVCSPKMAVAQGKPLGKPDLEPRILEHVDEWRFVISADSPTPPAMYECSEAGQFFVSPAFEADGSGQEHLRGELPRFSKGAVDRCLEIVKSNPRWRLSIQSHKFLRVR